LRFR